MGDFHIYAKGLVCMSVCTSLTDPKEIEERANKENPTGISSKWKISKDKKFVDGIPHPCPCDQNPKTHKHYLLNC